MFRRLKKLIGGRPGLVDVYLCCIFTLLAGLYLYRQFSSRSTVLVSTSELEQFGPSGPGLLGSPSELSLELKNSLPKTTDRYVMQSFIDLRIKMIPDVRSSKCRRMNYGSKQDPVSVIVTFSDYEIYDIKNVIGSLLTHGNMDLVEEIIVVNDGSTEQSLVDEAIDYFRSIPKSRLIHREIGHHVGARDLGAQEAVTEVLVFLDLTTTVTKGWLEPLLDLLVNDPRTLAVPHYDVVLYPVRFDYHRTPERLVATLSWDLAVWMREMKDAILDATGTYPSPALRGNVFAVRKDFYNSIGAYDAGLVGAGGENLELSLRTWLCGGSVKVVPCSRVGISKLNDPVRVSTHDNIRRITQLWFAEMNGVVLRTVGAQSVPLRGGKLKSLVERRRTITDIGQCNRSIDWYLEHVAVNMFVPSSDAVHFGMLRVSTGRCAQVMSNTSFRLSLEKCANEDFAHPPPDMLFELDTRGRIHVEGRCLGTNRKGYVIAGPCSPNESRLLWQYINRKLVNMWYQGCAMHVTDPDSTVEGHRQIAMAQPCSSEDGGLEDFRNWDFVVL